MAFCTREEKEFCRQGKSIFSSFSFFLNTYFPFLNALSVFFSAFCYYSQRYSIVFDVIVVVACLVFAVVVVPFIVTVIVFFLYFFCFFFLFFLFSSRYFFLLRNPRFFAVFSYVPLKTSAFKTSIGQKKNRNKTITPNTFFFMTSSGPPKQASLLRDALILGAFHENRPSV